MIMRGRRQKMIKYERGRQNPTQKRVGTALDNQEADIWIAKIDGVAKLTYDVPFRIKEIAKILKDLSDKIRSGEIDRDVLPVVLRRRNCEASVNLLVNSGGKL